jgi:hypothetical protein
MARTQAALAAALNEKLLSACKKRCPSPSPSSSNSHVGRSSMIAQEIEDILSLPPECGVWINYTSPAENNCTPLHYAIANQDQRVAKLLLKHKANPDQVDSRGWSPLLTAVIINGNIKLVQIMLQHRANPNLGDAEGKTAVAWCVEKGQLDLCKILLEYGANPDKESRGANPDIDL